jgi:hypothetical protein
MLVTFGKQNRELSEDEDSIQLSFSSSLFYLEMINKIFNKKAADLK